MGYAHVLWVHRDGIERGGMGKGNLPEAVGNAVLEVCLDPTYAPTPTGRKRITSRPVFGHGNCVNHAAELHSTDEQIFVWGRNCLRALHQLDDDELEAAKQLFDDLYEQRKNREA